MGNIKERFCTLHREFKSRTGYALISAVTVATLLLLVRYSGMPSARDNVSFYAIALYAAAAVATHLAADITCYMAAGLEMRRVTHWQGTLNAVIAAAAMGSAFYYIDMATPPGYTFVFSEAAEPALWIVATCNGLLACTAVAITTAFARGSVHKQLAMDIDRECEEINQHISHTAAEKAAAYGSPIIMDQIINLNAVDGGQAEIAVCDMIYACRRDGKGSVTIVYRLGTKTCRTAIDGSLVHLMQAFANYRQVVRCHADYIVNTERVTRACRRADGYELQLRGTRHAVPVGGKYRNDVYNALTATER